MRPATAAQRDAGTRNADRRANAGLADVEHGLLIANVHEHPFEDLVVIERLAGNVLEVPLQLAGVGVERHR